MTNSWLSSALDFAVPFAVALACAGCAEPEDGTADYAAGEAAFAAGDHAKAAAAFARSLEFAPSNVNALVCYSQSELALGEIANARRAIATASAIAPGDADVLEIAAQASFHAKDYATARAAYRKLATGEYEKGVNARGWAGLGVVEMAAAVGSDADVARAKARTDFLRAIRLDGRNPEARYHLGLLYRDSFGYEKSALDQFDIYVRLEATADARVQRVQRKVIPDLRETIARINAQRPGVNRRDENASAQAFKKAEDAWKKGQFKTAKLRYADAVAADVTSFPAVTGLARAWEKTDSSAAGLREALKSWKTACQLRPSSKDTLIHTGEIATKLGDSMSAVEAYSRAVAAAPNDLGAIDGLIRALRKAGRPKSAEVYQLYRDDIAAKGR